MTKKRRITVISLLTLGFGIGLISMVIFARLFSTSTHRLQQITYDLYTHPFAVGNAAARLKTTIYQIRSETLYLELIKDPSAVEQVGRQIAEYEDLIRKDLNIIKNNFLGDMAKVDRMEAQLAEWSAIRSEVLKYIGEGRFDMAGRLIKTRGTDKFQEILDNSDYVLDFAKNKASRFVEAGRAEEARILKRGMVLSAVLIFSFLGTAILVFWRVIYLQNQLDRQATTDFLTGIPNRSYFIQLFEQQVDLSGRNDEHLALALIDLDFFKSINDNYGHDVGDKVLKEFCRICQESLRKTDVFGRLGGEEFGILMPKTEASEAMHVIERLRNAVEKTVIACDDNRKLRFTASFGIASSLISRTPQSLDELFKSADRALYAAKENGRNKVVLH